MVRSLENPGRQGEGAGCTPIHSSPHPRQSSERSGHRSQRLSHCCRCPLPGAATAGGWVPGAGQCRKKTLFPSWARMALLSGHPHSPPSTPAPSGLRHTHTRRHTWRHTHSSPDLIHTVAHMGPPSTSGWRAQTPASPHPLRHVASLSSLSKSVP